MWCVCVCGLDEAECIIPLISDWLELDANDDWVRHDAEIVSRVCPSQVSALRGAQNDVD